MRLIGRIVLLMFVFTILFTFVSGATVLAAGDNGIANPGMVKEKEIEGSAQTGIEGISGSLLRYLQVIGSIVAVIILAVYGVQWFLASPQEKAVLKEKAWSYVIGAVLVFGGATLMVWLATTFQDAFSG